MSETTSTIDTATVDINVTDPQDAARTADGRPIIAMLGEAEAGGCCGGGSCAI
ncbi:hypothetical protein [Glaciibacter superstes]|uniref:hypothetical protein n=1 Tax=Glaciibacter superstes TaxID=501023 RepID=UPI0003B40B69|nr:hypothetical protein [Glaciibacter superstes]